MFYFIQDVILFSEDKIITQKNIELFLAVKGKEFLINYKPSKVTIIFIIYYFIFIFYKI